MRERIVIADTLQSPIAVSVESGVQLEHAIKSVLSRGGTVDVSFQGLEMATTAFVNAMVVPLYETIDADELDAMVAFVDLVGSDQIRVDRARARGIRHRAMPPLDEASNTTAATL